MSQKKSKFAPPAAKSTDKRPMKEAFQAGPSETTMFTLRMESALHKKLKLQALHEDRSMKEIIEELVNDYLDGQQ